MKINSHPEKKLEGILKQEILFKSAKKMIKELKRDIQGLPSMDYEESQANLYNFVVNRKVENTTNYSFKAHPLKKMQRTLSFELIKPKQSDTKFKHLRFGSREGKRIQSRNIQKIRRRSCCCSDCGHENTKIIHLMYKGATCHHQVEYANQLKKKKDFVEGALRFSQKIARRMILIKNRQSSKTILFRKRCNSCDTRLSKDMLVQHRQVTLQHPLRKDTHSKTQMRHTVFVNRQQTINDKLLLIQLINTIYLYFFDQLLNSFIFLQLSKLRIMSIQQQVCTNQKFQSGLRYIVAKQNSTYLTQQYLFENFKDEKFQSCIRSYKSFYSPLSVSVKIYNQQQQINRLLIEILNQIIGQGITKTQ